MGNCSSCMGSRRRDDYDEEDEGQHLFDDDPNSLHYGSFEDQQQMMTQEDPQEVQREIEALNRVVARTADNMVDIYEIVPQGNLADHHTSTAATQFAYTAQDPMTTRYHTLLSKLASHEDLASVARVDWGTPDDDTIEIDHEPVPIKFDNSKPLVGNFTDAAAAMR
ncbi:late endosomal/lysosomal adaptor and MAPK and MTOR activator-domain-containing protein [Podospora fimiseda]|uniref:Late endosomal/lysosomal adaptor and MAPK and MTOR activator-domain-containing protein n=1 Tax=Podospora fimiseda TaxID=252190 RepID=A0AAN7H1H8_9PEZI|nr:late endosomal/lysosomal adaptor and MAPK and MTOR activator-domain-containing protein [Podospora fimiseda]